MSFSSNALWLAVSSDKGTVHVFGLKVNSGSLGNDKSRSGSDANNAVTASGSSLSFIKGKGPFHEYHFKLIIFHGFMLSKF